MIFQKEMSSTFYEQASENIGFMVASLQRIFNIIIGRLDIDLWTMWYMMYIFKKNIYNFVGIYLIQENENGQWILKFQNRRKGGILPAGELLVI